MEQFKERYVDEVQESIRNYLKKQFSVDKVYNLSDQNGKILFDGQQFLVHDGCLYRVVFNNKEQMYIATKINKLNPYILKLIYPNDYRINYIDLVETYVINEEDREKISKLMDLGFTKIVEINTQGTRQEDMYCNFTYKYLTGYSLTVIDNIDNKATISVSKELYNNICSDCCKNNLNLTNVNASLNYWYNLKEKESVEIILKDKECYE